MPSPFVATGSIVGATLALKVYGKQLVYLDNAASAQKPAAVLDAVFLRAVAASYGARFAETLTGFKWIANRAMELEREKDYTRLGDEISAARRALPWVTYTDPELAHVGLSARAAQADERHARAALDVAAAGAEQLFVTTFTPPPVACGPQARG